MWVKYWVNNKWRKTEYSMFNYKCMCLLFIICFSKKCTCRKQIVLQFLVRCRLSPAAEVCRRCWYHCTETGHSLSQAPQISPYLCLQMEEEWGVYSCMFEHTTIWQGDHSTESMTMSLCNYNHHGLPVGELGLTRFQQCLVISRLAILIREDSPA